jgi:hypothetical protein
MPGAAGRQIIPPWDLCNKIFSVQNIFKYKYHLRNGFVKSVG